METGPLEHTSLLIIGAGPTGLGAGIKLLELKQDDFLIADKENYPGGLATSFVDPQGFTWDIGGHVLFSHYPYFDQIMQKALGKDGWFHHQRESWVWMMDRFVPYPFQNNIHRLPENITGECLSGLEKVKNLKSKPAHFEEWIKIQFGESIAKYFMLPYNFKVWAYPPHTMNYTWIGERVATIDIDRIKENIKLSRDDVSWGPNSQFQFPKYGGTGAIWKAVAKLIGHRHFCLNDALVKIDPLQKIAFFSSGRQIKYKKILNTMPLDQLTKLVEGLAPEIKQTAQGLKHSSTHVVGIGLKGVPQENLKTKCWMYFPEENCPFYRSTIFSNYSKFNVPQEGGPFWSIMTETSSSQVKVVDPQKLIDQVIDGLVATKLISAKERDQAIASAFKFSTEYGYPTPSQERDPILNRVIPVLDKLDIFSRGRFGGWKYEVSNQDHSFMQGAEWAEFIVSGKKEETFRVTPC